MKQRSVSFYDIISSKNIVLILFKSFFLVSQRHLYKKNASLNKMKMKHSSDFPNPDGKK